MVSYCQHFSEPSRCVLLSFLILPTVILKENLCFNTKNDTRKKHEICKHDQVCLPVQGYSFNSFNSQLILKQSAQEKTRFKLQTGRFDERMIGNGYTYKDTADRLYRKMISHQIRATYNLKKAMSLKISNKNRGFKNYLLSMQEFQALISPRSSKNTV
jgi:hypothetical protein